MRAWSLKLVVCALLAVTLSGCLSDTLDPEPARPALDAALIEAYAMERLVQDHDHAHAHIEHAGTIGFAAGATLPLRSSYPDGEAYTEMTVKDGWAYVAFAPRGNGLLPLVEAGFFVVDVTDPLAPELVSNWLGQPLGDIELTNDGDYVFASTQRNLYPFAWTVNPAAGLLGHLMRGTFIVDVSDRSAPTTVGFSPLPTNGPHTITYFEAPDGRELILQSTYDILFTAYPDDVGQNVASQRVVISEFVRTPGGPQLVPLSTFQILVEPETEATRFPHDATAFVHPVTKQTLMTVAYWDHGMVIVDITDPSAPVEVSRFADTAPSAYVQTHLVRVFPGLVDGRVVAVMEPEIPNGRDAGQFTFVDITDPTQPRKLGYWTIPGGLVIDEPFVFSPHNFDPVCAGNGQVVANAQTYEAECLEPMLVLSHFHGGLWVLDVADPAAPQSRAWHFPLVARDNPIEGFPWSGFFTAFAVDGFVYAPEAHTGLHVLPLPRPFGAE
jgi:hypothetical protein